MLMAAKSEVADVQEEHQRETEGLLECVREAAKEEKLLQLSLDSYIPKEFQEMISENVIWNEEIGEWQLRYVAYTGNNMRKISQSPEKELQHNELDLSAIYMSYNHVQSGMDELSGKAKKQKTVKPVRPKTGKKKAKANKLDFLEASSSQAEMYPESRKSLSPQKPLY